MVLKRPPSTTVERLEVPIRYRKTDLQLVGTFEMSMTPFQTDATTVVTHTQFDNQGDIRSKSLLRVSCVQYAVINGDKKSRKNQDGHKCNASSGGYNC